MKRKKEKYYKTNRIKGTHLGRCFYFVKKFLKNFKIPLDMMTSLWYYDAMKEEVRKIKQTTVRIDDELLKQVKYKLIEENKSFNEYVLELIKKDLEKSNK